MTGTLLSKASHSDELVTRINHANINCEIFESTSISVKFEDYVKNRLRTFIKGIGNYLARVVGLVPVDLKVTMQVYDEMAYTCGPMYFEGTRTGDV